MSPLKKKLIVWGTIIFIAAGYFVNEYVYSFAGFALRKIKLCEGKLIRASFSKDGFKRLNYPINLQDSASALSSDPNYSVIHNENHLHVSRMFGKLKYSIVFENRQTKDGRTVFYQYSVSCPECPEQSSGGEECDTANFKIYEKVYAMIRDLRIGDKASTELRSNIIIHDAMQEKNLFE